MSINTLSNVIKQIGTSAAPALLAMAASLGFASAQTVFTISSVHSGQMLDVRDLSKSPGALIQQYPANGGTNQQWTIRRHSGNGGSLYEIVSVNSGLVLDVPGSSTTPRTQIQQYPANGGNNQLWYFSQAAGSTGYEIVSVDIDVVSGHPGALSPDYNLVLDVPHSSTAPETVIQQYTENDGTNQQWVLHHQNLTHISLSETGGTITVRGWSFEAGSEACPVFQSFGPVPCVTVLKNGTFTCDLTLGGYQFESGSGHIVVTVEDKQGNLLAIGSVAGSLVENIP